MEIVGHRSVFSNQQVNTMFTYRKLTPFDESCTNYLELHDLAICITEKNGPTIVHNTMFGSYGLFSIPIMFGPNMILHAKHRNPR